MHEHYIKAHALIFLAIAVCVQGSITEPLAIHTLAQALKSSSLQSSGWSNLQDPDLNQMTYHAVSGVGEPPAAKKVKKCMHAALLVQN